MTMAEDSATHLVRLEERMKTQHAKGVTHIANQARHHTSQIARIEDKLDNISIEAAKREVRTVILMIAVMALATTILGILMSILISIPD